MKKFILLLLFFPSAIFAQNMYSVSKGNVSFYSYAPVENIEAHNAQPGSMINASTNEIAVVIPVRNFRFAKSLMEEHFNEKYMESEKYPMASFKGKIKETINFSVDSVYEVSAEGTMTIHGVEKPVVLTGKLEVKAGKLILTSEFKVKLEDYKITVPKLLFENIAEVIDVKVELNYEPYHKK